MPGAAVADLAAGLGAALADACLESRIDERGRRLLDDLLMAPLHGAVAVAEIDGVAVLVGQHLDLHVTRILEELLQVNRGIAESGLRLRAGHAHGVEQRRFGMHHAHAATAAAAGGLDDHRVAHDHGRS